jgi:hypothetical protein
MGFAGLFLQVGQEKVAAVNHALETLGVGDTGIVEQQVDPAVFGHHIVSQGFHGGGITDIRHVLGDL